MTREKIKEDAEKKDCKGKKRNLILHNDDFNLFDFVITSLIEVCGHTSEQAEQCALIAHYKGACEIKRGSEEELMMYQRELSFRDLTVSIN